MNTLAVVCFSLMLSPVLSDSLYCKLIPCNASFPLQVTGYVTMTSLDNNTVLVEADVFGLPPNSTFGFHIHQYGNLSSSDCSATGGHFNPYNQNHSCPLSPARHMGDMGNMESGSTGVAEYAEVLNLIDLSLGDTGVKGRAIIVHSQGDDCVSQPTGNAGTRLAQCVLLDLA